jgi:hypothetical protein
LTPVVHADNVTKENVAEPIRPMADPLLEGIYGLHAMLSPETSADRASNARRA